MDPKKASYRFTILFFNCMLTFGSYFCFDMPSTLKSAFQQPQTTQFIISHQFAINMSKETNDRRWSLLNYSESDCQKKCKCEDKSCCLMYNFANRSDSSCFQNNSSGCWQQIGRYDVDVQPYTDNSYCKNMSGSFGVLDLDYCEAKNTVKSELSLSSLQYEAFYASYAWTNAAMAMIAGILVDKLGNHLALVLFSTNCLVGSALFALGAQLETYPLMLIGRIIFGLGNGSLTIVQNKITATWFQGKELALAFGFTMSLSRAGSVLNFNLSPHFCNQYGLIATLWGGVGLTCFGLLSALIVSHLDRSGRKKLGKTSYDVNHDLKEEPKKMKVLDFLKWPPSFWFLTAALCFFYNGIFPFMAEAPDFIRMKYKQSSSMAGILAGLCYDMSMILSPFMGGLIDKIGKRGYLTFLCGIMMFPVFYMLGFTNVTPYIPIVLLGLTYSLAAAALWPSVPLLVGKESVGLAYGILTSLQMISIGVCNFIIADLRDGAKPCPECKTVDNNKSCHENLKSWNAVMLFMMINAGLCIVSGICLNICDLKKMVLNGSKPPQEGKKNINSEELTESDPLLQ